MTGTASVTIAETVSEKKRRGRPPIFERKDDAVFRAIWGPDLGTTRTLRNKQYLACGQRAIKPDGKLLNERYRWFAGDGRKNYRQAVLVELGRIDIFYGEATAIAMADKLAEQVASGNLSTTREAAAWLRRARLSQSGRPSKATVDALERLITTTIIAYVAEHPDVTPEMVRQALCGAYELPEVLEDMDKRREKSNA